MISPVFVPIITAIGLALLAFYLEMLTISFLTHSVFCPHIHVKYIVYIFLFYQLYTG